MCVRIYLYAIGFTIKISMPNLVARGKKVIYKVHNNYLIFGNIPEMSITISTVYYINVVRFRKSFNRLI